MDARERLRKYLEQRREMGEVDLVLDTMSVEDVLKLVGGKAAPGASREGAVGRPTMGRSAPSTAETGAPVSNDWREAIRSAGSEPSPGAARIPPDTPITPPADLPRGITVGKPPALDFDDIAQAPSLEAIADMVRHCTRCPLHLTAKHGVPGEGHPQARFVCVGEAPGATEDETGRPFVGAAGQLLTKILAAIDLRREDVFICNVMKHRPPGNRNPAPNEIAACSPYLVRQLELIKPGVILALGTFAAQTLLETKESIGKLRGRIHRYHGIPLVVTYHPAALLRNPSWKRPTWDDVQLARRILDSSALTGA